MNIAAASKIAIVGVIAGSRYPLLGSEPRRVLMNQTPMPMEKIDTTTSRKSIGFPSVTTVTSLPLAIDATMTMTLQTIIEHKRGEIVACKEKRPLEDLRAEVENCERPRNFFGAVVNGHTRGSTSVIAEIKRKSPSAGVIREDFDPVAIALAYEKAGASAISCLTDTQFFGGNLDTIQQIRSAISLPVLRKDFIIDEYQIWESRAAGADALLLIAEVLPEGQLVDCMILAQELGMTSLVEVHDMENLLKVQQYIGFPHAGYCLLGINNRNLETMKTDINHTIRLIDVVDDPRCVVSESGITSSEDLDRLRAHGVHIVLVGESLMKQPCPGDALASLIRMNP